mmetsp:Transcript_25483/g.74286  ORF Transcript_25483/g.74286 Transcript_25483/m.74286 type:complete len:202 (-) Transcript_25483:100-705(-)
MAPVASAVASPCLAILLLSSAVREAEPYSQGSLMCCSSLTRPDNPDECEGKLGRGLICPQTRNSYCVKEVLEVPRKQCGRDDSYDFSTFQNQNFQPFDGTYSSFPTWPFRWDDAEEEGKGACVYRKCAAECQPGTSTFEFQGEIFTRTVYCCDKGSGGHLCNAAGSLRGSGGHLILAAVLVGLTSALLTCTFVETEDRGSG